MVNLRLTECRLSLPRKDVLRSPHHKHQRWISDRSGDATMPIDPRELLPRNKHDCQAASAIIALGYPAVAPVLPDLLMWLQDFNWPVSRPISDFLATIPEPMAPHIRDVLQGNDLMWKYWCIHVLISKMPREVAEQF